MAGSWSKDFMQPECLHHFAGEKAVAQAKGFFTLQYYQAIVR
jgi:hypothetical protein